MLCHLAGGNIMLKMFCDICGRDCSSGIFSNLKLDPYQIVNGDLVEVDQYYLDNGLCDDKEYYVCNKCKNTIENVIEELKVVNGNPRQ